MTFKQFMIHGLAPDEDVSPGAAQARYQEYLAAWWGSHAKAEFEQRKGDEQWVAQPAAAGLVAPGPGPAALHWSPPGPWPGALLARRLPRLVQCGRRTIWQRASAPRPTLAPPMPSPRRLRAKFDPRVVEKALRMWVKAGPACIHSAAHVRAMALAHPRLLGHPARRPARQPWCLQCETPASPPHPHPPLTACRRNEAAREAAARFAEELRQGKYDPASESFNQGALELAPAGAPQANDACCRRSSHAQRRGLRPCGVACLPPPSLPPPRPSTATTTTS
jgi:hypothetical protein